MAEGKWAHLVKPIGRGFGAFKRLEITIDSSVPLTTFMEVSSQYRQRRVWWAGLWVIL